MLSLFKVISVFPVNFRHCNLIACFLQVDKIIVSEKFFNFSFTCISVEVILIYAFFFSCYYFSIDARITLISIAL